MDLELPVSSSSAFIRGMALDEIMPLRIQSFGQFKMTMDEECVIWPTYSHLRAAL